MSAPPLPLPVIGPSDGLTVGIIEKQLQRAATATTCLVVTSGGGLFCFVQQQPEPYRACEMMNIKCQFTWWRKLEYPEEISDLWQVTSENSSGTRLRKLTLSIAHL